MNAHLYTSDWDYYDSFKSPAELLAQNIMDGSVSEVIMEEFGEFLVEKYGGDYEDAVEFAEGYLKSVEECWEGV